MRVLLSLLILVGCGTESDNNTGPVEVVYLTGSETVNAITCAVSAEAIAEETQQLEMGSTELEAIGAECVGRYCRISSNFDTKYALCGTQEIYKGVTQRIEYKTFYNPL